LVDVVPAKGRYVRNASAKGRASAPAAKASEVATQLRQEIGDGKYPPGEAFLSEKDVCDRYDLTRYAARLALAELEAAGLIVAVHGKGRRGAEARGRKIS